MPTYLFIYFTYSFSIAVTAIHVDGMGHESHYKTRNHYQQHRKHCDLRIDKEKIDAVQMAMSCEREAELYATRIVPRMHALMNTPSQQFHTFVRSLLEQWPPNVTIEQFLALILKKTGKLQECESVLADELWEILKSDIDKYAYVGAAVDTRIDRMKGEHILLCVVYSPAVCRP